MAALPVEILLGVYLGLLVGIIPALMAWFLAFLFKYFTKVTLPGLGAMVLAIALAGVNGGLLSLTDTSITKNPAAPRLVTAILVVGMMAMYAHSKGDAMGATVPHRLTLKGLRSKTLALDLADVVADRNEVRIRVVGEVADVEGYPPLSAELRAELRQAEFTFPADLTLAELEERMAARLEAEYDLGAVQVSVDERGRAAVAAAPPSSGLSRRVADDRRAVSIPALLPTGLARGDEVTCRLPDGDIRGTVVSARCESSSSSTPEPTESNDAEDESVAPMRPTMAPTTSGGEGRLTVAVPRGDVERLLKAGRPPVVVEPEGTRREFEVISLLRRSGRRFRQFSVRSDASIVGQTLAEAGVRTAWDVAVLAHRNESGWTVGPRGDVTVAAGDDLLVAGRLDALRRFQEAIA
ncbi:MAG: potassium channel family protein [Salinirussus sp.]